MKKDKRTPISGQALVMVTFALFAIVGLIGLAVDFGWMYFLEKNMQSAADAAAMAAISQVLQNASGPGDYACAGGVATCRATPVSCTTISSGNLRAACLYASQNGFNPATDSAVNVRVQASDSVTAPTVIDGCTPPVDHPPTAPCVNTFYWVTVRIAQRVPQLFSAITGNTSGIVAARATAAIAESTVLGSLILINRENDNTGGVLPVGTNLYMGGSGTVTVPGGIILASSSSTPSREAGRIQGSGRVSSPFTNIRDTGTYAVQGGGSWTQTPVNSPDNSSYWDPMYQKGGQPPLNVDSSLPRYPVINGNLNAYCTGGVCPPGIYYAAEHVDRNQIATRPTGARLRIGNNTTIRFGGTSPTFAAFGDWYFVGGLEFGANSVVTMDPGRYGYLGVADTRDPVLDIPNGVTLNGGVSENFDAGRLLITSNFSSTSTYPGLSTIYSTFMSTVQNANLAPWNTTGGLRYSTTQIQAGNNDRSVVNMFGLKRGDPDVVSAGLNIFTPAVLWQDKGNSYVRYDANGRVDYAAACGGTSLNSPCTNSPSPPDAPELLILASPYANWGGMIYQPRGAWTRIQASGSDTGPLMIVTGGLQVQGSGSLTLTGPEVPLTNFTASLVE